MPWAPRSFDPLHPPLFYMGRFPVYVTTLMVMIHVAMMVLMAVTGVYAPIWRELAFSAPDVIEDFKFWKVITYAIITPPEFMVALGLVFFFFFGRSVEERLGRNDFVKLYASLWILAPLAVLFVHLISGRAWLTDPLIGSSAIHFAVFLGFAFYHPNVPTIMFMIPIKWLALFFVVVSTLSALGSRYMEGLLALWLSFIYTYVFLRRRNLPMRFPAIEGPLLNALPERKPKAYRQSKRGLRLVKGRDTTLSKAKKKYHPKITPRAEIPESRVAARSIDPILEKISQKGIGSLTAEERRLLEEASSELSDSDLSK